MRLAECMIIHSFSITSIPNERILQISVKTAVIFNETFRILIYQITLTCNYQLSQNKAILSISNWPLDTLTRSKLRASTRKWSSSKDTLKNFPIRVQLLWMLHAQRSPLQLLRRPPIVVSALNNIFVRPVTLTVSCHNACHSDAVTAVSKLPIAERL